jgi:hypothetical protein
MYRFEAANFLKYSNWNVDLQDRLGSYLSNFNTFDEFPLTRI